VELRQLRAFLEVASIGHFGHAAERLHLTQPALTHRIQGLEKELGVQLLERSARGVRLTPAGEVLEPFARTLVQTEAHALRELHNSAAGITGRLRVAYLASFELSIGFIVAEYRHRFPLVEVLTSEADSMGNIQRVHDRSVDAAFVDLPITHPDSVAVRSVVRDELLLALPPDHHLAKMKVIPAAKLRGEPIIMPPAARNPTRSEAIVRWLCRNLGEDPNIMKEDPSDLAYHAVAESHSAVTLVPRRQATTRPFPGVVYRPISPAPLFDLAIAYVADDKLPTLANLLKVGTELASLAPLTEGTGDPI
jgi:DNA-binding transcriptional LysR family regulator